ncbi:MAG: DUF1365 domain-containing protein [Syntrophobacteraceae bacterium]|nr:DUF1365 domain-containing protein [Syntrophobacteraceae bacterium]
MRASCIYEGTIRHRRFRPILNVFQYRVFLMFIDLADLPDLFEGYPLWSSRRPNLAYFRRRDHMGDPNIPLDTVVRDLVEERLGTRPSGPVRMLAHLRYFGYCFNPVSFYYCYGEDPTRAEALVAEVHNTPWGEKHCYVLGQSQSEHPSPRWKRFRLTKQFHISPFMPMTIDYDWRFQEPGETLGAHLTSSEGGRRLFDATLGLRRSEIDHRSLTRVLIAYPLMTLKVITLIYYQAARLLLKGAPFFSHPSKPGKILEN